MPLRITYAQPAPGESVCPHCGGKGVVCKYDLGWSSLCHDPGLAALYDCSCRNGVYTTADGPPRPPVLF